MQLVLMDVLIDCLRSKPGVVILTNFRRSSGAQLDYSFIFRRRFGDSAPEGVRLRYAQRPLIALRRTDRRMSPLAQNGLAPI
jgi:hypothetical protein